MYSSSTNCFTKLRTFEIGNWPCWTIVARDSCYEFKNIYTKKIIWNKNVIEKNLPLLNKEHYLLFPNIEFFFVNILQNTNASDCSQGYSKRANCRWPAVHMLAPCHAPCVPCTDMRDGPPRRAELERSSALLTTGP